MNNSQTKNDLNFLDNLKTELDTETNFSITENGMTGYRTTNHALLDCNFKVSSFRSMSNEEIIDAFSLAYHESGSTEDKILCIKWLFYVADIREGLGERRTFRILFDYICKIDTELVCKVLEFIPEYNRWDSLIYILDANKNNNDIVTTCANIIRNQFTKDLQNYKQHKEISLLAKWMPSINSHSPKTRSLARLINDTALHLIERNYRKSVSLLREYLNIVERNLSAKTYDKIDYSQVPSKASLLYKNAFLRNDMHNYAKYLEALKAGNPDVKVNASVTMPYEIVHKYDSYYNYSIYKEDILLESAWKALPNVLDKITNSSNSSLNNSTIVVQDDSGSMITRLPNSSCTMLNVARSLAIYFSEKLTSEFKDKFITFSSRPQFMDLSKAETLKDKLNVCIAHSEVSNTNIHAVFNLILNTAIKAKLPQTNIPKNILIISDMEFDYATECAYGHDFDLIKHEWVEAGYELPRLIFWNLGSRTGTIPVTTNKNGVVLLSGFSQNAIKMVLSGKTDPWDCLLDTLNSDRYSYIEEALKS